MLRREPGRQTLHRWRGLGLMILAQLALVSTASAAGYRTPRTPWGEPNLQGQWTNFALTRLERPLGVPAR
ncbi:MAG TPA: hypothetical protein VHN39_04780, partial [Phenylobacterium sp.]|nr:hypothetical protein [Phenylobacterium sp.]